MLENDAKTMLVECPYRGVLVTHTPPFGFSDLQSDGSHEGSQAVLDSINEKQPVLHLCGHIHHSWGASSKKGDTLIHNLGPTLNWFEI